VPRADIDKALFGQALLHCAERQDRSGSLRRHPRRPCKTKNGLRWARHRHGSQGAHDYAGALSAKAYWARPCALIMKSATRKSISQKSRHPRISKDMVSLASHILLTKGHPSLIQENSRDEYENGAEETRPAQGQGPHHRGPPKSEEKPSNVINLMDALARKPENEFQTNSRLRCEPKRTVNPTRAAVGSLIRGRQRYPWCGCARSGRARNRVPTISNIS